jgi:hypothetical protein
MEASTQLPRRRSRLRLAKGIVKAVFTTPPRETTEVVAYDDGQTVVKAATDDAQTHTDAPEPAAANR